MDATSRHLLDVVNEIRKRLREGSRIGILQTAGLLRQLFVDGGNSIAPRLSGRYGVKLVFRTSGGPNLFEIGAQVGMRPSWGYVNVHQGTSYVYVDLDKFLKRPCFYAEGECYTVRDVISACANKEGGVHFEEDLKKPRDQALRDMFRSLQILEMDCNVAAIRDMMQCVVDALAPLEFAITRAAKGY